MFETFKQTLYVKILRDSFELLHAQDNRTHHQPALRPFSTLRLAVGQFQHAEEALRAGVEALTRGKRLRFAPVLIMHQRYLGDDELSQVEERVLRELGLGAGARQVYVWQGSVLTREQILQGVHLASPPRRG